MNHIWIDWLKLLRFLEQRHWLGAISIKASVPRLPNNDLFFLLFVKGWCSFIIYDLSQILQKHKTLFYLLLSESKSNHNITTKLLRSPKCWMTHKGLESVCQILLCSNTNKNDMHVFGHVYSVPNICHTECINMLNYFPLRPSGFLLM